MEYVRILYMFVLFCIGGSFEFENHPAPPSTKSIKCVKRTLEEDRELKLQTMNIIKIYITIH